MYCYFPEHGVVLISVYCQFSILCLDCWKTCLWIFPIQKNLGVVFELLWIF